MWQAARFGMAFESTAELCGEAAEGGGGANGGGVEGGAHEEEEEPLAPDSWLFSLRLLRLLNTLRSSVAGLPLSHEQLVSDLRLPRLVDKCALHVLLMLTNTCTIYSVLYE